MGYSETKFTQAPFWARQWIAPAIVTAALAGSVLFASYVMHYEPSFGAYIPSSTVLVQLDKGHGSGVHIGDGLILTAAHVASEGDTVSLKLDDGTTRTAEVVWASKSSDDVALLRTGAHGLAASPLNCAPPVIGQAVTAHGSPLTIEFISTYGHIVGPAQVRGEWASAFVVDMEIIPGMSGGAVLNPDGEVVGLAVGLATMPIGFSVSATGIGFVVPSSHICALLGRT